MIWSLRDPLSTRQTLVRQFYIDTPKFKSAPRDGMGTNGAYGGALGNCACSVLHRRFSGVIPTSRRLCATADSLGTGGR